MKRAATWLRGFWRGPAAAGSNLGASAYDRAMATSGELIERFKAAAQSTDPIRAMFADMWLLRHNVPYATTIYEAHQEMVSPLRQDGPPK